MIIITGAAGFIGSVVASALNKAGREDLILVDDFTKTYKSDNFAHIKHLQRIERMEFFDKINDLGQIDYIIHLGARTDTTETDVDLLDLLNLNYTKQIWEFCAKHQIPLIYASSAATYGLGEFGYNDEHKLCEKLQPLNAYGRSKNDFDIWALQQENQPPNWFGLKFFNVYGPNEFHKSRMASVIFHTHRQILATGGMKLFRSHKPDFKDGEQMRDFIYVKDVVKVISFLMKNEAENGIYNLGTGTARTFWDLAANTFSAMNLEPNISFIETPADLRDKYQYFTEANMSKLRNAGYDEPFLTLEEGITDYVQNYLMDKNYF
ncbi:MAG: ADP-glyceromanno-heptose 6-epimerase [Saprospiraceae bacterium]